MRLVRPDDGTRIGTIAARLGVSRETFTRSFYRRVGMSPHAFRIVGRLNVARGRIRNGASIANAAAACGFADQSHLGRHFRRV
ncbi:AraC family transcriptional regulator, partial [Acinetobacter baumannii]